MKLFAPHATDGYKLGHPSQYVFGTSSIGANMTPRDFGHAVTTPETVTGKMVFVGLQYACKEYLIDNWNKTFFSQPKEVVMARYERRIKGYLGTGQGKEAIHMMSQLHDLGYLPVRIKALPEGSRVNAGIPIFTVRSTLPNHAIWGGSFFHAMTNYLETVLSNTVWPMCNSASIMEQYYLLAKKYGAMTGASVEHWLPFAMHCFALRGHRGMEDGIMSAFGHAMFHKGSDSFAVADFAEDYYGATDEDFVCGSVNATEHATVCQNIAYYDGDEKLALNHFLVDLYPTGVLSYVSDSKDYWDLVGRIIPELKDVILARGPSVDGQPGVLTLRPDSSKETPYEVIMGYEVFKVVSLEGTEAEDFGTFRFNAVLYQGKIYRAEYEKDREDLGLGDSRETHKIVLGRELDPTEAIGTLQSLWNTFGGTNETGSNNRHYKLLDSHIRIIYGEAISLAMAHKIYSAMYIRGWCVGNVFFGVGSWAFLKDSSRDSYGLATKATNSIVNGEDLALQKDPKGTSTFKKSAKGRLRVELDVVTGNFVLFDNQTPEQEEMGLLETVFENSQMVKDQTYKEITARCAALC